MTDEQKKAQEFAEDRGHDNQSITEAFVAALDMAEWKDEEHSKEKQQWIDKACEWINDNYFEYLQPISCYEQLQNSIDINAFVNDFKKYAEEQL